MVNVWFSPHWIVRTALPLASMERAMQNEMQSVDPKLPFNNFQVMNEIQSSSIQEQRYQAAIFSTLAALALILTALGLYGMIAQAVADRTRELGIRMALGATLSQTISTLVRPALLLAGVGLFAGAVAAWFASALLKSFLWGVQSTDPATFAAVSVALLIVALGASLLPALRVSQLDPAVTLRAE
jgi:ABC-type antimicrobial peptide transport system permease subunit